LTTDGFANNSDWPGYVTNKVSGAEGSGFRGGSWNYDNTYSVSNRNFQSFADTFRSQDSGWRGGKTAP
jgi:hypothetical protein